MKIIATFLTVLLTINLIAQSGDFSYRIVIYDYHSNSSNCNENYCCRYKVYACEPSVLFSDDLQIPKWQLNNNLNIVDTLTWVGSENPLFPIKAIFQGNSIMDTKMLLIIKNDKDTMFIENCGENLISVQNGQAGIYPLLIQFNKGIYDLLLLKQDRHHRIQQNWINRNLWLFNSFDVKPQYDPLITRINELNLLKKNYQKGDTLQLKVSGHIETDGSCSNEEDILWILQKKNGDKWVNSHEFYEKMDCSIGVTYFEKKIVSIALLNPEEGLNTPFVYTIKIDSGRYRLVVFDDYGLPYFTEEFEY